MKIKLSYNKVSTRRLNRLQISCQRLAEIGPADWCTASCLAGEKWMISRLIYVSGAANCCGSCWRWTGSAPLLENLGQHRDNELNRPSSSNNNCCCCPLKCFHTCCHRAEPTARFPVTGFLNVVFSSENLPSGQPFSWICLVFDVVFHIFSALLKHQLGLSFQWQPKTMPQGLVWATALYMH